MALSDYVDTILNRPTALIMLEQMRKLFMRLYPYMVPDFAHLADVQTALSEIDLKLEALAVAISAHTHPVVEGAPLTGPSLEALTVPPTVITPTFALSLIIPVGYPQPTGEGVPAVMPSRQGIPDEIVATPPLSPAELF